MSGVEELRQKLVAGKNERVHGHKKYMSAKFYENLTRQQYSGNQSYAANGAVSRDALNPKARLALA